MNARRLVLGSLVFLACSRSPEDAGIVLNVDTDVTADRTAIDRLAVTVDGRRQEWTLMRPLPGSLGLKTSPGKKSVTVEGLRNSLLLGTWSGAITATKGSVIVQDVHLACVTCGRVDAGPDAVDSGMGDGVGAGDIRFDALDGARDIVDSRGGEAFGAGGATGGSTGLPGTGGISGRGGATGVADGGSGGIDGRDVGPGGSDAPATGGVSGTDARTGIDGAPLITAPLSGVFSVASQFEIPATAAAPGPVGSTLKLVHGLVEDPASAILTFAEDAGVPALSTLRSALPDVLESRLTGWMNSYIKTASVSGVSPYDQLVTLDALVQSLLLDWGMRSRLALPIGVSGTHSPVSLAFFGSSGTPVVVPLDATASVTSGIGVTATLSWPNGPSGAAVVLISDHFMGFPFGRYALQGLNAILLAEYGTPNLAAYLSQAVGCSGMARYVASQCVDVVLDRYCVNHESDLLSVCEGGLAEGAKQIEDQIRGLDFKAIHFILGTGTAVGAVVARPQDATALANGAWTATVDFGSGPELATATFSAMAESAVP